MITTIAVITANVEKKKFSDRSDRSDNDCWDRKSAISAIVVAAKLEEASFH